SIGGTNGGFCLCMPDDGSNFQWYRNGTAVPGATNDSYWVNDTGKYKLTCMICNYIGAGTEETVSVRYDTCSGIGNEELYAEKFMSIMPTLASSEIIVSNPRPDLKIQWTLFNLIGQATSLSPIDAHGDKLVFDIS